MEKKGTQPSSSRIQTGLACTTKKSFLPDVSDGQAVNIVNISAEVVDVDPFLQSYFAALLDSISDTKLYIKDNRIPSKISDIYVSLPLNLQIDIRVKDKKVVEICQSNTGSSWEDVVSTKFTYLIDSINSNINANIEYAFQNISERPKILAPTWSDGEKLCYWTLNGIDALSVYDSLVILGDPGQGKSTLLKILATKLIEQFRSAENVFLDCSLTCAFTVQKYVPIFIELRDFVLWVKKNVIHSFTIHTFYLYIKDKYLNGESHLVENYQTAFEKPCVLILDGLDEIILTDFNKSIVNGIIRAIKSKANSKLILSCRERDYAPWKLNHLPAFRLEMMDKYTANLLVKKIFTLQYSDYEPSDLFRELSKLGMESALIGNPLFLSLIAQLYIEPEITFPKTKGLILRESIKILLKRKPHAILDKEQIQGDVEMILPSLEKIAYKIHQTSATEMLKISKSDIGGIICTELSFCTWDELGTFLTGTAGIISKVELSESNEQLYEFTHRYFQEYLCASYLIKQEKNEDALQLIANGLSAFSRVWGEVALFYIELLSDYKQVQLIWDALYFLSSYTKTNDSAWIAWLIAKIIECRDFSIYNTYLNSKNRRNDIVINEVKTVLQKAFEDKASLPLRLRAFCGRVLGLLGDSRRGVGLDSLGDPDIIWCPVISNNNYRFSMGIDQYSKEMIKPQQVNGNNWGMNTEFPKEEPQQEIQIRSFDMSKYPITVEQFHAFEESLDGYNSSDNWAWSPVSRDWFDANGKKEHKGKGRKNVANCPVTDVNWIEAVSFCKWFSKKTGQTIRLPTEGEWEAVAKKNHAVFSWGDSFEPSVCNSSFSEVGDIVPVGTFSMYVEELFPSEMNGNVWEWCNSVFPAWNSNVETLATYEENKNFIGATAEKFLTYDTKVSVRGGSYINPPFFLRNTFRGRDQIGLSFYRQGFRVIRENTPHVTSEITNAAERLDFTKAVGYFKKGSGAKIIKGDKIRISYLVRQNDSVVEDMMSSDLNLEIVLGSGQIHKVIEEFIIENDPRISTSFEKVFSIQTGDSFEKSETYDFYILIQDKG